MQQLTTDLAAGFAGTLALTALHEAARRIVPSAPRMDIVGQEALGRIREAVGKPSVQPRTLFRQTFAGEPAANTAYYGLVSHLARERSWSTGLRLGALAGIGALVLPRIMGLADPPQSHLARNQLMTVTWYVVGALATVCTYQWLSDTTRTEAPQPHMR